MGPQRKSKTLAATTKSKSSSSSSSSQYEEEQPAIPMHNQNPNPNPHQSSDDSSDSREKTPPPLKSHTKKAILLAKILSASAHSKKSASEETIPTLVPIQTEDKSIQNSDKSCHEKQGEGLKRGVTKKDRKKKRKELGNKNKDEKDLGEKSKKSEKDVEEKEMVKDVEEKGKGVSSGVETNHPALATSLDKHTNGEKDEGVSSGVKRKHPGLSTSINKQTNEIVKVVEEKGKGVSSGVETNHPALATSLDKHTNVTIGKDEIMETLMQKEKRLKVELERIRLEVVKEQTEDLIKSFPYVTK